VDQPAMWFQLDPAERTPKDINTANPPGKRFFAIVYRTAHFFSTIRICSECIVFNVGHPAKALLYAVEARLR
jgi:hypothetical protein